MLPRAASFTRDLAKKAAAGGAAGAAGGGATDVADGATSDAAASSPAKAAGRAAKQTAQFAARRAKQAVQYAVKRVVKQTLRQAVVACVGSLVCALVVGVIAVLVGLFLVVLAVGIGFGVRNDLAEPDIHYSANIDSISGSAGQPPITHRGAATRREIGDGATSAVQPIVTAPPGADIDTATLEDVLAHLAPWHELPAGRSWSASKMYADEIDWQTAAGTVAGYTADARYLEVADLRNVQRLLGGGRVRGVWPGPADDPDRYRDAPCRWVSDRLAVDTTIYGNTDPIAALDRVGLGLDLARTVDWQGHGSRTSGGSATYQFLIPQEWCELIAVTHLWYSAAAALLTHHTGGVPVIYRSFVPPLHLHPDEYADISHSSPVCSTHTRCTVAFNIDSTTAAGLERAAVFHLPPIDPGVFALALYRAAFDVVVPVHAVAGDRYDGIASRTVRCPDDHWGAQRMRQIDPEVPVVLHMQCPAPMLSMDSRSVGAVLPCYSPSWLDGHIPSHADLGASPNPADPSRVAVDVHLRSVVLPAWWSAYNQHMWHFYTGHDTPSSGAAAVGVPAELAGFESRLLAAVGHDSVVSGAGGVAPDASGPLAERVVWPHPRTAVPQLRGDPHSERSRTRSSRLTQDGFARTDGCDHEARFMAQWAYDALYFDYLPYHRLSLGHALFVYGSLVGTLNMVGAAYDLGWLSLDGPHSRVLGLSHRVAEERVNWAAGWLTPFLHEHAAWQFRYRSDPTLGNPAHSARSLGARIEGMYGEFLDWWDTHAADIDEQLAPPGLLPGAGVGGSALFAQSGRYLGQYNLDMSQLPVSPASTRQYGSNIQRLWTDLWLADVDGVPEPPACHWLPALWRCGVNTRDNTRPAVDIYGSLLRAVNYGRPPVTAHERTLSGWNATLRAAAGDEQFYRPQPDCVVSPYARSASVLHPYGYTDPAGVYRTLTDGSQRAAAIDTFHSDGEPYYDERARQWHARNDGGGALRYLPPPLTEYGMWVHSCLHDDWVGLLVAWHGGFTGALPIGNTYRSTEQQVQVREQNGCSSASGCRVPTAAPAASNHQLGYAADVVGTTTSDWLDILGSDLHLSPLYQLCGRSNSGFGGCPYADGGSTTASGPGRYGNVTRRVATGGYVVEDWHWTPWRHG